MRAGEPLWDDVGSALVTDFDGGWEAVICLGDHQYDLGKRHATIGQAIDAAVEWGNGRGLKVIVGMLTIRKPNLERIEAWQKAEGKWAEGIDLT